MLGEDADATLIGVLAWGTSGSCDRWAEAMRVLCSSAASRAAPRNSSLPATAGAVLLLFSVLMPSPPTARPALAPCSPKPDSVDFWSSLLNASNRKWVNDQLSSLGQTSSSSGGDSGDGNNNADSGSTGADGNTTDAGSDAGDETGGDPGSEAGAE